jgi:hypothetical protein
MADQTATAFYDPAKTDPSQLVSAFADAKASGESRFTLTVESSSADTAAEETSQTSDTSNDFAPPLPPGAPTFGEADGAGAGEASAPAGGDFDVSLEAPAE